jgi:autotransporter-associated beta strand protein
MSAKPFIITRFHHHFTSAAAVVLCICGAEPLLAAPRTWSGGGADNFWNSSANWNGAIGSGDSLTFAGGTRLANSNNLSANTSFAGITFSSGAGDFVLSGNAIRLSSDIVNSDNAGNQTINLNVAFSKNSQINTIAGGTTVIDGALSGSINLTINNGSGDTGLLVLGGANSYSGTTTISNGVLRIRNSTALGAVGSGTTVSSGAALELQGNIAVGAEALSIVGSGVSAGGAMRNVSGNNSYGGLLTLGGATRIHSDSGTFNLDVASGNAITGTADALTFGGAGNIIVSDAISNTSGTLSKEGAGTLTLAAANTYSGTTSISAGTLRALGNASALGSGALAISGGTLELANDTGLNFGRNTTISGNATIVSGRASAGAGVTHSLGTLAIGAQTLTLSKAANVSSGTAGLSFGATTLSGAATFVSNADTLLTLGSVAGNFLKTFDGAGNATVSGVMSGNTLAGVTKKGGGTLLLEGNSTYTGVTTINAGTLSVANIGNGGAAGNLGQATGVAANLVLGGGTLKFTGASQSSNRSFTLTANTTSTIEVSNALSNFTISGTSANTNGGLIKSGAGTLTLAAANAHTGLTTVAAGKLAYGVNNALASGGVTVDGGELALGAFSDTVGEVTLKSGSITGNGTLTGSSYSLQGGSVAANLGAGVMSVSSGTTTLSGSSISTAINLNSGSLVLGGADRLSNQASITIASGAVLGLGGYAQTVATLSGGGEVRLGGAGTGRLTVGAGNSTSVFTGVISGNGSAGGALVKTGTGTLTLSGANTYNGTTSVNAGALVVNGSLGGGNVDVANDASLSGNASIGGALNVSGVLMPGNSVGTLSVSQGLALGASSIVRFDLNAASPGIGLGINDLIDVGGNLTLDGTLDVLPWDVAVNGNFSTRNSGSWTLFHYTGSLADNGLTLGEMPTLAAGYEWRLDTSAANAVTLNIVPEPRSALLGGFAVILLFRRRR